MQPSHLAFLHFGYAALPAAASSTNIWPRSSTKEKQRRFFEVHAENYMGAGGPPHRALEAIRRDHPVSLHGVCMSIGGPEPLDRAHLARFRDLVERYEPALVSEHLAWSTHQTTYFNDLLPLPYTEATLRRVCDHIDQVQEAIWRPLLLENPSTYLAFGESTMGETEFIRRVARAHRMRPIARHQQCVCLRNQSRILAHWSIFPTFRWRASARSILPVMPSKRTTKVTCS